MGPGSVRIMRISPGAGNWARSSLFFMIFRSVGCVRGSAGTREQDLVVFGLEESVGGPEGRGRDVVEQGEQDQEVGMPAARVAVEERQVVATAAMGEDQEHLVALRHQLEGDIRIV